MVVVGFVQIIEFRTSRIDEIRALVEQMRAQHGPGTALRGTVTEDVDRPGYYLNVVEFESQEAAMDNSARPEVSEFASKMAALCDEAPRFYNLRVVETWDAGTRRLTVKKVAGTAAAAAGVAAAGAGKIRQRLQDRRAAKTADTDANALLATPQPGSQPAGTTTVTSPAGANPERPV